MKIKYNALSILFIFISPTLYPMHKRKNQGPSALRTAGHVISQKNHNMSGRLPSKGQQSQIGQRTLHAKPLKSKIVDNDPDSNLARKFRQFQLETLTIAREEFPILSASPSVAERCTRTSFRLVSKKPSRNQSKNLLEYKQNEDART